MTATLKEYHENILQATQRHIFNIDTLCRINQPQNIRQNLLRKYSPQYKNMVETISLLKLTLGK